jgi:hypothetical protein
MHIEYQWHELQALLQLLFSPPILGPCTRIHEFHKAESRSITHAFSSCFIEWVSYLVQEVSRRKKILENGFSCILEFMLKTFYRVAPSPTLCGKIVAPYMLLLPWTASIPYRRGMPKRVFRAARWKSSVMLSHNSGVAFGAGTLPPPLSILPA